MTSMASVYLPAMFATWFVGHYGLHSKYRCRFLVRLSLIVIFMILFIISGFRTAIGDTEAYKHSYRLTGEAMQNTEPMEIVRSARKEKTFTLMVVVMNEISSDPQLMIAVLAFITNAFNLYCLYKYARPFDLSIYLYFATSIYYVTMNGMRQALAASIFFWGSRWIIQGKKIPYLILVLFLTTIHESAWLLLPVYWLARQEVWEKKFWTVCMVFLFIFAAFPVFRPLIVHFLSDTSYNNYGQQMASQTEGVGIIRVMVMLVAPVLSYILRKPIKENWKESSIFVNMSVLNFLFILLGVRYLYFYRVCMYFELFNLVLIPRMLNCLEKKLAVCLYVYIAAFYFIYAYYQIAISWGDTYRNILFS